MPIDMWNVSIWGTWISFFFAPRKALQWVSEELPEAPSSEKVFSLG